VVAQAPADWGYELVLPVFSATAVVLGFTTGALGEWVERVGPRVAGTVGAASWGASLVTCGAAVETSRLVAAAACP
jgi:hypothetical protein